MTYSEKLKDPRWQKMRLEILQRDGFACKDCGDTDSTLHVHHCHYQKGDPWDTDPNFLLTLCEGCHELRGANETKIKEALGVILSRLHGGPDDEELAGFGRSIIEHSKAPDDEFCPSVGNYFESEYMSDGRWFSYAWEHPEARECYDVVTGQNVQWLKLDEVKK